MLLGALLNYLLKSLSIRLMIWTGEDNIDRREMISTNIDNV